MWNNQVKLDSFKYIQAFLRCMSTTAQLPRVEVKVSLPPEIIDDLVARIPDGSRERTMVMELRRDDLRNSLKTAFDAAVAGDLVRLILYGSVSPIYYPRGSQTLINELELTTLAAAGIIERVPEEERFGLTTEGKHFIAHYFPALHSHQF